MKGIKQMKRDKHRYLKAIVFTLILSISANSALGQTIARERFIYAPGPINGMNGGTNWAAPWVGNGALVVSPGLSCPGTGSAAGNALGTTPGSASTRKLAQSAGGTPGTHMVLRALIKSNVAGTPGTQATLGNINGAIDGHFIIGDLPQADLNAGKWGLQNAAGRFYSSKPVVQNATTLLIARIDFNFGNDRMRLWVKPCPYNGILGAPDIDVTNVNIKKFSGVFWQTQGLGAHLDQLRIRTEP